MSGGVGPPAESRHPLPSSPRIAFLKNVVTNPNIVVGDYTYYDDPEGPERFESNVLYHVDFVGDRLVIGKFCSIAHGATFIMNGGNHRTDWSTNYPFPIFGHGWQGAMPEAWPAAGGLAVVVQTRAPFMAKGVRIAHALATSDETRQPTPTAAR